MPSSTPETAAFLTDYRTFITSHAIAVAAAPAGLPSGEGRYKLRQVNEHTTLLEASTNAADIPAYLVNPMPNNRNSHVLPGYDGKYMLTSEMGGCQFIAYGPDRHHVTVEHNNFIDDPAQYAVNLAEILAHDPPYPYLFHIHADPIHNVVDHRYRIDSGIEIVGQYHTITGWEFFVRDNITLPSGTLYGPF